jgi:plasmid stability protein
MAILHVRNVPDGLYERIRERAQAERRTIGGEVITLLEQAVAAQPPEIVDSGYAEFRRRADALRREAQEWHEERRRPRDSAEYVVTLEGIRRRALERAERYGPFPDSLAMLHEGREERTRQLLP